MQTNNEKPKSWKLLSLVLPVTMAAGSVVSTAPAASANQGFINYIAPMAQAGQQQYGVPASVAMAQAILESGWGRSGLTTKYNAYFGIKCGTMRSPHQLGCVSMGTREYINGRSIFINDGFRTYRTGADSFRDHGHFLRVNSRYGPAFRTRTADDFARAIARAGYATDPNYANALINLMNRYNLRRFDTGAAAAPARAAKPVVHAKFKNSAAKFGSPLANATTQYGGTWQEFSRGMLVDTPNGQFIIRDGILKSYKEATKAGAKLGLPLGNEQAVNGGWKQPFQHGDVFYTTSDKKFVVRNGMAARYRETSKPKLALPTSNERAEGNSVVQDFANGRIFWTPQRGGIGVVNDTYTKFKELGGVNRFGLPTAEQVVNDAGSGAQNFDRGAVTWSKADGYQMVVGGIYATYKKSGSFDKLGAAKSGEQTVTGGWIQSFENGTIFFSNKKNVGGFVVTGGIAEAVEANGGLAKLGMPIANEKAVPGGWSQDFENGTVFTGKYGSFVVSGEMAKKYAELGGVEKLGVPTSAETTTPDGSIQKFRHGEIHMVAGKATVIRGAIFAGYDTAGGAKAAGAPLTDEYTWNNGWRQDFANGSVVGGGSAEFNFVPNQIMDLYKQRAEELGKPIGAAEITETQISQTFQNGTITVSKA